MQWSQFAGIGLAAAALAAVLSPSSAQAATRTYVSAGGTDVNNTICSMASPCATIGHAVFETAGNGIVSCLDSNDYSGSVTINLSVTIDCGNTTATVGPFTINDSNATVVIKGVTIFNALSPAVTLDEAASVILDGVTLSGNPEAISVTAATTNLTVKNSLIQNNTTGVVIQPGSSGSVTATFDNVSIIRNAGGGIKIDTTNGPVTLDVTDSVISKNAGNGINTLGNAGGQAIVSIKNSVIARNGGAGVQANGANAGVLIATTLLDQNAVGATSVVNGGNMFTYGNNQIVGPIGSGFTSTATLH